MDDFFLSDLNTALVTGETKDNFESIRKYDLNRLILMTENSRVR